MKKFLIISVLLMSASFGIAQKNDSTSVDNTSIPKVVLKNESRFFLNVHAGYAFGLGSTFKFYPDNVSSIRMVQVGNAAPTKTITYSSPTKGLGQGFRFGAGISYIVNDFINLGLDLDYFKSTIYKYRDSSFSQTKIPGAPVGADEFIYYERQKTSYDATLLTLSPNITFKAISRPKWYLYNKLGAVVTFRPNSTQNDVLTTNTQKGQQGFIRDSATRNVKTFEWGIRNPAFGFMGGVGAQFRLSQKVRFYSELQFSHIVFVVKKRTTTNFKVNEMDMLSTLPLSEREINFSTEFTVEQQAPNPNVPSQAITERIPITYLGVQVGLSYKL
jgi:hypothetical protein